MLRSLLRWLFAPSAWRRYFAPNRLRQACSPRAWFDLGFKMVDVRRLDFYLRWLVVAMLVYYCAWLLHWREWLTDYGFHYTKANKHWYHPDPWAPLPVWAVPLYVGALLGSGLAIVWGWRTRVMIWVFFACSLYALLVDADAAFTINKYGVAFTLLIALSYAPGMFQTVRRSDGAKSMMQSVWPIRIIMAVCFIQYFTAGYCKLVHGDWVSQVDGFPYYQIDEKVLWSQVMGVYRTDVASFALNHFGPWFWKAGMFFTLGFELGVTLLLLVRPLRPIGIVMGVCFHFGIALLMYKLVFFSLQMCTFYLLFIDETLILGLHGWFGRRLKEPLRKWARRIGAAGA